MAKKEINYPSQEWIDKWVDKWLDKNPNEKVDDFAEIEKLAMAEWWDKEIDANRPTPFDPSEEEKKNQRKVTATSSGTKAKSEEKKARPKDDEKLAIIAHFFESAKALDENAEVLNEAKEIAFTIGENHYSLSLIKHRAPKK